VIAYRVTGDTVSVLGVYYGGQDYDARFLEEPDEH
jgi:toxin ParE1/3/4